MSLVDVQDLKKIYFQGKVEVPALKGVSLKIEKGEFLAIAGPSGSGKTTLLNHISGLDHPSSGTVKIDQQDLNGLSKTALSKLRLHKIGFIFQSFNLIPVLSALENVEFVMQLQGLSAQARREKALQILAEVGLKEMVHRRPLDLSGGQQQRVAVARAIVSEPVLIIADEPTANLDSATAKDLIALMKNLNQEKQITFVFSTHDQMVMDSAMRLIRLKDGLIVQDEKKKN
ncbi:macrolide ABC transporter ATP-binding protein [bacterium (Candidatus Blackallbacteria) CG17_big_fil_post_rev_8_21_14_2_50_48_46]|uniref:Macrolide ABC transporter ATP-binding protein n=1 Tax=bacterium (Candidatus Blackallbacteria) CG17_big_fil_post_rev_8_21_14_2_50_48_46 TaxID=2014261 RepID=A0A2M7G4C4_9BACT|nr:MAG: macrolide ABC transporter ATP-binding protein [bacterium (Candidatus Blackallbacteria) CG18_big_fil_WC_8_21_14_2_50_49_26]PIW16719.1 MAG: macrolide ABC transporter ATP-binding protein [bacterium (Candidatus Blackallbacteria) CG17_big_fil_post_rev_8_21_14_2_50_48_46]PIW46225.1 MAG: macrolide ABC transporter ATP-binding protein [bacterium (Candidatus Blackallbacteria) CG13_big_fil_rev_8_21_14_2_50_49_14]